MHDVRLIDRRPGREAGRCTDVALFETKYAFIIKFEETWFKYPGSSRDSGPIIQWGKTRWFR
jgi:hypothetical protein